MQRTKFNADYIQKALAQAYKSEQLTVESLELELKKQNCEYFYSDVYRCNVKYRKTPESTIEVGKYIIKDLLYFFRCNTSEKLMFEKILPAMDEILGRALPPLDEHKLGANCLYCESKGDEEIHLLEDLNALNYTSLDRHKGLNVDEAKICLQKLAQFHAASMVLIEEQPDLVAQLTEHIFITNFHWYMYHDFVVEDTKYAADIVASDMPEIAAKMKAQIPDAYFRRMRSVVDPSKSPIKVILHGEPWINNMLINRAKKKAIFGRTSNQGTHQQTGKHQEVHVCHLLVDFQNSCLGSPAIDLNFFFYTSPEFDGAFDKQAELLEHYNKCLKSTLIAIQYNGTIPDFADLNLERTRCEFYNYFAAIRYLPIRCASPEASENFSLKTLINEEEMAKKRKQLFDNGPLLKQLKKSLVSFDQHSILEAEPDDDP